MRSPRPPRLSPTALQEAAPPPRLAVRAWWPVAVLVVAGLLVLAWVDGGEEPLRPIAEDVALPEQVQ
jgi:hypothetical protein